jgi:hypothetical protein
MGPALMISELPVTSNGAELDELCMAEVPSGHVTDTAWAKAFVAQNTPKRIENTVYSFFIIPLLRRGIECRISKLLR